MACNNLYYFVIICIITHLTCVIGGEKMGPECIYECKCKCCNKKSKNCQWLVIAILASLLLGVIGVIIGAALATTILANLATVIVLAIVLFILLLVKIIISLCSNNKCNKDPIC